MTTEKEHPSLVIELPNGTVMKLYQPITEQYLKQLIDEFLIEQKLVVK